MSGTQGAILGGIFGGAWLLLLWLGIIVWTYRDIRERTQDPATHTLSVALVLLFFPGFNLPGLMLYLVLRPKETLDDAYARSLEEEALLREVGDDPACQSCHRYVEKDFLVCPYCQAQLKDACANCNSPLRFSWIACPYCATPRHTHAQARTQSRAKAQPDCHAG